MLCHMNAIDWTIIHSYTLHLFLHIDLIFLFQTLSSCPEEESVLLSSIQKTIANLSVKQGRDLV